MSICNRSSINTWFFNVLFSISFISCTRHQKIVIKRFPDGSPAIIYDYANKNDTSDYIYTEYSSNGKLRQIDSVIDGKIIGKPTIYHEDGSVARIDSLFHPRDRYSAQWDGIMTNFFEGEKYLVNLK